MISCKTALSIKNTKITIFNFLNRYSELWALLFSKLKKAVNLRILRSANFGYRWNRFIGGKYKEILNSLESLVLYLAVHADSTNSFFEAKVLKVLFSYVLKDNSIH